MSPLWWMQSTGPHCRVMLEEVTADVLMEMGGADGAGRKIRIIIYKTQNYYIQCSVLSFIDIPADMVVAFAVS